MGSIYPAAIDPIYFARIGYLDYFKIAKQNVLLTSRDSDGRSAFSIAADHNHLECCEEIYRRCPTLLYSRSAGGETALHCAALKQNPKIVKFLIHADAESRPGEKFSNHKLLAIVNRNGYTALHLAAENGNLPIIRMLIEADLSKTTAQIATTNDNLSAVRLIPEADASNLPAGRLMLEACADASESTAHDKVKAIYNTPRMEKYLAEAARADYSNSTAHNEVKAIYNTPRMDKYLAEAARAGYSNSPAHDKFRESNKRPLGFFPKVAEPVEIEHVHSSGALEPPHLHQSKPLTHSEELLAENLILEARADDSDSTAHDQVTKPNNTASNEVLLAELAEIEKMLKLGPPKQQFEVSPSSSEELLDPSQASMMVDDQKKTCLHVAVEQSSAESVRLIIEANSDNNFLQMFDINQHTCLHLAVQKGDIEIVSLLIQADPDNELLQMVDGNQETALHMAVEEDNLELVRLLTAADHDKGLLKMVNVVGNAALHLAVRSQIIEIVECLVEADPNFEYFANDSGDTPLLIAMRGALSAERSKYPRAAADCQKMCKSLIKKDPKQCTVQLGEQKWTLLHYATVYGLFSIIEDIIRLSPGSPKVVDHHGQNFLHIAAKLGHVNMINYFLQREDIDGSVLNTQDTDGNTPLHVAVQSEHKNVALCLLYEKLVDKTLDNNVGEKAIDLIKFSYDEAKARVYSIGRQRDLKDQSNFDVLAAGLIATVSFTAGITVPGGYENDGTNKGSAIFLKDIAFEVFAISNTIALMCSLYTVFLNFSERRLLKKENIYYEPSSATFRTRLILDRQDIIYYLNAATIRTSCAIYMMVVAFVSGSFAIFAKSERLVISVCVCSGFFLILATHSAWKMAMQYWRSE